MNKQDREARALFWDRQPFGEMSDCQLAKKIGYSVNTVRRERGKRKIAAYRKSPAKPNRLTAAEVVELRRRLDAAETETKMLRQQQVGARRVLGMHDSDHEFYERICDVMEENVNLRMMLAEKLATWVIAKGGN